MNTLVNVCLVLLLRTIGKYEIRAYIVLGFTRYLSTFKVFPHQKVYLGKQATFSLLVRVETSL